MTWQAELQAALAQAQVEAQAAKESREAAEAAEVPSGRAGWDFRRIFFREFSEDCWDL